MKPAGWRKQQTSCSPPLLSHFWSSALCRTFFRNSFRRLCWASPRRWTAGFGRAGRAAYLKNLEEVAVDPGIGDDWTSRRVARAALESHGDSGGEEARMGEDESGEDTAGR